MYFSESNVTADFRVDSLEDLWPSIKQRVNPHTIVINADNGPENSSRRTQFINRLVDFGANNAVIISLVYYPPYHSKYNPVERVWGVLEKHWNGQILDSVEKVLGLCRTISWNGNSPVVKLITGIYEKGVTLTKKAMDKLETLLDRIPGIEKWTLDIPYCEEY